MTTDDGKAQTGPRPTLEGIEQLDLPVAILEGGEHDAILAVINDYQAPGELNFVIGSDGSLYAGNRLRESRIVGVGMVPSASGATPKQQEVFEALIGCLPLPQSSAASEQSGEFDERLVRTVEGWLDAHPALPDEPAPSRDMVSAGGDLPDDQARGPAGEDPDYQRPEPFDGSPEQLELLRKHVINLRRGQLSEDGLMRTSESDLVAIAQEIVTHCVQGDKTLLLYAHGGLTNEKLGLASAWAYFDWWMAHKIYPIFFIWETGALETLWQILDARLGRTRAMTRDIFDLTTDPVVEGIASGPGTVLWDAMKRSAELASEDSGGCAKFAGALKAALGDQGPKKVIAVGHSAGSIFHAHLLPRLGLDIAQLHLLAPAITHPLYEEKLDGVAEETFMFTMNRSAERADNCAGVYRKSLLYLVSNAFEQGNDKAILGMEDFWPGKLGSKIEVIFGPTRDGEPPASATGSSSHGGFDNDRATMESVLRRIKGQQDDAEVSPRFPKGEIRIATRRSVAPNYYGVPEGVLGNGPSFASSVIDAAGMSAPVYPASPGRGGKRHALCIGNNSFGGSMDLAGCIPDAQAWAQALRNVGFENPTTLVDAPAQQMREEIRRAVELCDPGDTLIIHISSHGTQIPDRDGDEREDDAYADDLDEAVLGTDYATGGLVVDDEWPSLLACRAGVHIVRFHDFCHAGRTTRMAIGREKTVRSVRLSDPVAQRAVAALGKRAARGQVSYGQDTGYLTFCACLPHQLAAETNGMGLFSRAATEILAGHGAGLSARQLAAQIAARLAGERQEPLIEGPDSMVAMPIFGPAR